MARFDVSTLPAPSDDPALDDLDVATARERLLLGRWAEARAVLGEARQDTERRIFRVGVLSEAGTEDRRWLDGWRAESPDEATLLLMNAEVLGAHALRARGVATAAATSSEQFHGFRVLSEQSEEATHRAIEAAPDDPAPWLTRMISLFAGGRARADDFSAALAQARRRDPFNLQVNTLAVTFASDKWFGSHDEMFSAARTLANAAAVGSGLTMLPVLGHLELALREFAWPGRKNPKAWRKHFERREVVQELDWCIGKWRAGGSPQHALSMRLRGWEALVHVLGGRQPQARAVYDEIGPYLGDTPQWSYWGLAPAQAFEAGRRWAYGAGKRVL